LPDPVGAMTRVWSPRPIEAHASAWAGVGAANEASNQALVASLNPARSGTAPAGLASAAGGRADMPPYCLLPPTAWPVSRGGGRGGGRGSGRGSGRAVAGAVARHAGDLDVCPDLDTVASGHAFYIGHAAQDTGETGLPVAGRALAGPDRPSRARRHLHTHWLGRDPHRARPDQAPGRPAGCPAVAGRQALWPGLAVAAGLRL